MKRMSLEKEKMQVDYTAAGIPESVSNFRPEVYRDGDTYCCILGTDLKKGVFGFGDTIEEALTDWDLAYRKRKEQPVNEKDEVGKIISKEEKWPEDEVAEKYAGHKEKEGRQAEEASKPRK